MSVCKSQTKAWTPKWAASFRVVGLGREWSGKAASKAPLWRPSGETGRNGDQKAARQTNMHTRWHGLPPQHRRRTHAQHARIWSGESSQQIKRRDIRSPEPSRVARNIVLRSIMMQGGDNAAFFCFKSAGGRWKHFDFCGAEDIAR